MPQIALRERSSPEGAGPKRETRREKAIGEQAQGALKGHIAADRAAHSETGRVDRLRSEQARSDSVKWGCDLIWHRPYVAARARGLMGWRYARFESLRHAFGFSTILV